MNVKNSSPAGAGLENKKLLGTNIVSLSLAVLVSCGYQARDEPYKKSPVEMTLSLSQNYGPLAPTRSVCFVRGPGAEGATRTNLTRGVPGRSRPLRGPAGRPGSRPGVVAPARFVSQHPRQALRPATTVGLTRVLPSPGPG